MNLAKCEQCRVAFELRASFRAVCENKSIQKSFFFAFGCRFCELFEPKSVSGNRAVMHIRTHVSHSTDALTNPSQQPLSFHVSDWLTAIRDQ